MKAQLTVEVDVELPDDTDLEAVEAGLSLEIPKEQVQVFLDSTLLPGARVTGWTSGLAEVVR